VSCLNRCARIVVALGLVVCLILLFNKSAVRWKLIQKFCHVALNRIRTRAGQRGQDCWDLTTAPVVVLWNQYKRNIICIVVVPPQYCRLLARTGSDDTHHYRFSYTTGSDDTHHYRFVVRTGSYDALLYIGWVRAGEIFRTLSNCRVRHCVPPHWQTSLPLRPPLPPRRRPCFTMRLPERGSRPTPSPPRRRRTTDAPAPSSSRHCRSTSAARALFFLDAAVAPTTPAPSSSLTLLEHLRSARRAATPLQQWVPSAMSLRCSLKCPWALAELCVGRPGRWALLAPCKFLETATSPRA
jgi:hypothetical protein